MFDHLERRQSQQSFSFYPWLRNGPQNLLKENYGGIICGPKYIDYEAKYLFHLLEFSTRFKHCRVREKITISGQCYELDTWVNTPIKEAQVTGS